MVPRKIEPLRADAIKANWSSEGNCACAFNRMLAISNSSIESYFYGMPEELEALAMTCAIDYHELSGMSVGQVASTIAGICEDDLAGATCDYSPLACAAIAAFMAPLAHAARNACGKEEPIPSSDWGIPRCDGSSLFDDDLAAFNPEKVKGDFMSTHHVARKSRSPEARIIHSFRFTAAGYCVVVSGITHDRRLLEEVCRFGRTPLMIFTMIERLISVSRREGILCSDPDIGPYTFPEPEQMEKAYDLLYRLFVRPYARMFADG